MLVDRVRAVLASVRGVEEKRMFGGTTFMVNGKMCVSAGAHRLMCRIDPALHEETVQRDGCRTVVMNGRKYKGFVHVSEEVLQSDADLRRWIELALAYNAKAKPARKPRA